MTELIDAEQLRKVATVVSEPGLKGALQRAAYTIEHQAGWQEAGVTVDQCFEAYGAAKTMIEKSQAFINLCDAMSDLRTWIDGFDSNSGTLPWQREEWDD